MISLLRNFFRGSVWKVRFLEGGPGTFREDEGHPRSWGWSPDARHQVLSPGWELSEQDPSHKGCRGLSTPGCLLVCAGQLNPAEHPRMPGRFSYMGDALIFWGCSHTGDALVSRDAPRGAGPGGAPGASHMHHS